MTNLNRFMPFGDDFFEGDEFVSKEEKAKWRDEHPQKDDPFAWQLNPLDHKWEQQVSHNRIVAAERMWPECKPMDHFMSCTTRLVANWQAITQRPSMQPEFNYDNELASHDIELWGQTLLHYLNACIWRSYENNMGHNMPVEDYEDMIEAVKLNYLEHHEPWINYHSTIAEYLTKSDIKWLHIELDAVHEYLESDGMIPQRYLENLHLPFPSCAIMYDKPTKATSREVITRMVWWETLLTDEGPAYMDFNPDKNSLTYDTEWQLVIVKYSKAYPDHLIIQSVVASTKLNELNNPDFTPPSQLTVDDEKAWEKLLHADEARAKEIRTTIEEEIASRNRGNKPSEIFPPNVFARDHWYPAEIDLQATMLSLKTGDVYTVDNVIPVAHIKDDKERAEQADRLRAQYINPDGSISLQGRTSIGNIYPSEVSRQGIPSLHMDRIILAQTVAATLAYTMGKGFSERYTMSRNQRRRLEREASKPNSNQLVPKPFMYVDVAPMDEKVSPATGTGTPHGHQYDVRGHVRHTKRRLKDGTIQHNVGWVKSHVRGPEESEYIPKVHSYSGDMELTSPVKKFIIEGPTEQE